jgi:hypothetical protein
LASADKEKLLADLSAYLDGELSPERAREVERFLSESEEARRTLADLRAVCEALRTLPRMHAPGALPERVRRSVERQVLLPKRPPAGRARVLKLAARISASAAVIAACVFAGWTVLHRIGSEVPSELKPEIVSGHGGAASHEARRTLAKRAPADKLAHPLASEPAAKAPALARKDEIEASRTPGYEAKVEREPAVAMAPSKAAVREVEAAVRKGETVAPEHESTLATEGTPVAVATWDTSTAPAVNVVVRPRDANEYSAALQTVALWQQAPAEVARLRGGRASGGRYGWEARADMSKKVDRVETPAVLTQQDFVLQVPPAQFNEVLRSLDEHAPGQVLAAVNFNVRDISQVQQMVMPAAPRAVSGEPQLADKQPPPAGPEAGLAPTEVMARERGLRRVEPDAFGGGRLAGRGGARGRVARSPPGPKAGVPAEGEQAERERVAAYRSRQTLDTKALERLRTASEVGDAELAKEAEELPPIDEKEASADQRHPRVEDIAAGVSTRLTLPAVGKELEAVEPVPINRSVRSAAPLASAALLIRDHFLEIGEQLGEICEIMVGAALHPDLASKPPEAAPSPPPAAPITLRVTLLPPPSTATTQPDAQPIPPALRSETP